MQDKDELERRLREEFDRLPPEQARDRFLGKMAVVDAARAARDLIRRRDPHLQRLYPTLDEALTPLFDALDRLDAIGREEVSTVQEEERREPVEEPTKTEGAGAEGQGQEQPDQPTPQTIQDAGGIPSEERVIGTGEGK